jgi:hypothetical protein
MTNFAIFAPVLRLQINKINQEEKSALPLSIFNTNQRKNQGPVKIFLQYN